MSGPVLSIVERRGCGRKCMIPDILLNNVHVMNILPETPGITRYY
jgi:hypothetical protein